MCGGSAALWADDVPSAVVAIESAFIEAIARAEASVVSLAVVRTTQRDPVNPFRGFERVPELDQPADLSYLPERFGSGVVIARQRGGIDRYVLTNAHVLHTPGSVDAGAPPRVYARLANRRMVGAVVVASDPRSDLAILKLTLDDTGIDSDEVVPIQLGDASGVRKGQLVLALGNPYAIARDGSASASWGMISNISRRPAPEPADSEPQGGDETIHRYGTLLHVDTRLDVGASGGALINLQGELIGLTTALAALDGYEKSVGFAIAIDRDMRRVIDELLQGYEVEYGFLGVRPSDVRPEAMRALGVRTGLSGAARTVHVALDSPAARAGLRPDDLIMQIDDVPVRGADDLMRVVGLLGPGADAMLHVWRPDRRREFQLPVRLAKWPVEDDTQIVATQRRFAAWRGLDVDYPTARRRYLTSDLMETYHRAVLVIAVADSSAAHAAGLRPGDLITTINHVSVETPDQFHTVAKSAAGEVRLTRLNGEVVVVPEASQP